MDTFQEGTVARSYEKVVENVGSPTYWRANALDWIGVFFGFPLQISHGYSVIVIETSHLGGNLVIEPSIKNMSMSSLVTCNLGCATSQNPLGIYLKTLLGYPCHNTYSPTHIRRWCGSEWEIKHLCGGGKEEKSFFWGWICCGLRPSTAVSLYGADCGRRQMSCHKYTPYHIKLLWLTSFF